MHVYGMLQVPKGMVPIPVGGPPPGWVPVLPPLGMHGGNVAKQAGHMGGGEGPPGGRGAKHANGGGSRKVGQCLAGGLHRQHWWWDGPTCMPSMASMPCGEMGASGQIRSRDSAVEWW